MDYLIVLTINGHLLNLYVFPFSSLLVRNYLDRVHYLIWTVWTEDTIHQPTHSTHPTTHQPTHSTHPPIQLLLIQLLIQLENKKEFNNTGTITPDVCLYLYAMPCCCCGTAATLGALTI